LSSLVQVFLASSQPPHQKQVFFQAATIEPNKTIDKKKIQGKDNEPKSHIDNILF
jgi:hypothetical protein